jgi:hypothetical protein
MMSIGEVEGQGSKGKWGSFEFQVLSFELNSQIQNPKPSRHLIPDP